MHIYNSFVSINIVCKWGRVSREASDITKSTRMFMNLNIWMYFYYVDKKVYSFRIQYK